jgi:4-amino-4-deoxy-L-arabinose transferase-like glycosyltransferase
MPIEATELSDALRRQTAAVYFGLRYEINLGLYRRCMSLRATHVLLVVMLVGLGLRVATLSHESLSFDELFSRKVALLPMLPALHAIRDDLVHPPFYYLLLKAGISTWGASPLGIRLWSLFFGIGTLALAATIGGKLDGARNTGLLAAMVLAVNADLIFYSQEARPYSLCVFLVLLLVCWVSAITRGGQSKRLWIAGYLLMVLLVYTNYIAAIYVASAVLAILLCNLPRQTKLLTLVVSIMAAISFLPWLISVAPVYGLRNGIGENLNWQGHPSFYDLRSAWAASIGVIEFRGATTMVFLLVIVLSAAGLKLLSERRSLRDSPVTLALVALATLPPITVFCLSVKPFNLPIFGLRQILPSIPALCLLSCYGLEALVRRPGRFPGWVFVAASTVLVVLGFVPTFTKITHGPSRIPYDTIAEGVRSRAYLRQPVYATSENIEEPVNYYCRVPCVEALPAAYSAVPDRITLLYRPAARDEARRYQDLLNSGFVADSEVHYTNGMRSEWGTTAVHLRRTRPQSDVKS